MNSGGRLHYPESYEMHGHDAELLLLPRSYLGFESLHSPLRETSSGFSFPSAIALAESITTMFSKSPGHWSLLMHAWAADFPRYGVLDKDVVDRLAENTQSVGWSLCS